MLQLAGKSLKLVIFLLLTAIVSVAVILMQQSGHIKKDAASIANTNEVLYQSQKILAATNKNKIIIRDFIVTGKDGYLQALDESSAGIRTALKKLESLTTGNALQRERIAALQPLIDKDSRLSDATIAARKKSVVAQPTALVEAFRQNNYGDSLQQLLQQVETIETGLLAERKTANQLSAFQLDKLMLWLVASVLVLVVIIIQNFRVDFLALKKTARKLSESQEQLELVFNNVKDYAIFTTDIDGNVLSWNQGAELINGYKRDEIMGKRVTVFYPADSVKSGEPMKNLDSAKQHGRFETKGWRVKKDGTLFWADIVITALYDQTHSLKGFAKITRDITEQRNKQEDIAHLSRLVEQTSDAIFSTDTLFHINTWNKAAEKLYGYSEEEAVGQELGALVKSRLTDENRKKAVDALIEDGSYHNETEYRHKNGETIFVLASVTSIRNEHGVLTGYVGVHRDISERKKLEDQLIRFNEALEDKVRLKTAEITGIFERISDGFVAFDKNWCYTYINKKAGDLIKRKPETMIGKNVWDEFPAAVGSATFEIFNAAFRDQQNQSNTDYYAPLDLWQENHVYPSPEGISVFIKDITDKKKAEEKINASNERVQVIADATNDAIWDWDLRNHSIWWNKNFYTYFGYTKEESTPVSSRYNGIHPEDRARVTAGLNHALETFQPYWQDEYRFLKADGTDVFVLDRGNIMYNKKNEPYRMVGAMVDLTSIRKAEEKIISNEKRFRALLRNSTDGLTLVGEDGSVVDISPSGSQILGYSYDELIGTARADLIHIDDRPVVMKAFDTIKKDPGGILLMEYRHKMLDNSYKWLECSYNNLLNEPFVNAIVLNYRDVTERKAAAEKIRTNQQMLARAEEIGEFGSWEYNAISDKIMWSDSMYQIHGIDKNQPISFDLFYQHLYPPDIAKVKNVFRSLREKEQRLKEEYRFRKDNGEIRFAHTTIDAIFENGKLCKTMGVVQDITERKKAESVLLQSQARYRKAQSQGQLGHWELDVKTQAVFLSDEIYNIYNLGGNYLANGFHTLFSSIHPDDQDYFASEMAAVMKGEKNMDIVHRIVRKDGKVQYVHEIAELEKDSSGQPLRLIGMAQDITQQKLADENLRRSEHKYRLLFENNPMPMWMSSIPELNILDVNEAALRQYGYSREEFLRLNSMDLRSAEDLETGLKEADKTPALSGTSMQWRHQKKDGSIIYVEIFNYQIIYEGMPVWLGLSIDITEKTKAEAMLKKSYEEIRQLASRLQDIREEERASMAREIHDELGQQLTGLKMDISWLARRKDVDEIQREHKIKEILLFIDGTVNTVRKLSAELRPSILDDLGLVEALEWWSSEFEKRSGISCNFQPPEQSLEVPSRLAIGLFRIYQESLTNVARHANAKTVFSKLEAANNQLILEITDDGKGFDTSTIGHKKTLGLLGMKERTLMMGGTYEITSEPGNGTTVTIAAPFVPADYA